MPDEPRCACCDLPLYSCGNELARLQAEERKARAQRALQLPGVIPARMPGRCPSCRSPIELRDPIRKTDDGWVSVLCCPDEP